MSQSCYNYREACVSQVLWKKEEDLGYALYLLGDIAEWWNYSSTFIFSMKRQLQLTVLMLHCRSHRCIIGQDSSPRWRLHLKLVFQNLCIHCSCQLLTITTVFSNIQSKTVAQQTFQTLHQLDLAYFKYMCMLNYNTLKYTHFSLKNRICVWYVHRLCEHNVIVSKEQKYVIVFHLFSWNWVCGPTYDVTVCLCR